MDLIKYKKNAYKEHKDHLKLWKKIQRSKSLSSFVRIF